MLIPPLIIYVTCLALSALSKSQNVRTGAYIAVVVMHILVAIENLLVGKAVLYWFYMQFIWVI